MIYSRILVLSLLLLSALQAHGAGAIGFIVLFDGSHPKEYSPAYEYSKIEYFGQTFQLTLLNGKTYSDMQRKVLVNMDYTDSSPGNVKKLEEIAKWNVSAAQFLKVRIPEIQRSMKRAIESVTPAAPSAVAAEPAIEKIVFNGAIFTQVIPRRIQNGRLMFKHAGGDASVDLQDLTLKALNECAVANNKLRSSPEFADAVAAFVPVVVATGKVYKGVRLVSNSNGQLELLTDDGPATCNLNDLAVRTQEAVLNHPVRAKKLTAPPAEPAKTNSSSGMTTPGQRSFAVSPPAPAPPAPKPVAAVPPPAAPAADPGKYGGIALAPTWMPTKVETRKGAIESIDYYCRQILRDTPVGSESTPDRLWGPIRWLMPLNDAISALSSMKSGLSRPHKGVENRITQVVFPENSLSEIEFEFDFLDPVPPYQEVFGHLVLILDAKKRVISLYLEDRKRRAHVRGEGTNNAYFNVFDLTKPAFGGAVQCMCDRGESGAQRLILSHQADVRVIHWYLPAPFARCLSDIMEHQRKMGGGRR